MNLKLIAQRELQGIATEQELKILNDDYKGWNEALSSMHMACTEAMVKAKAVCISRGSIAPARTDFENRKAELIEEIGKIINKKRLVKSLLKDERDAHPETDSHGQMLRSILDGIQELKEMLNGADH